MIITGIGSRKAPANICQLMTNVCYHLAKRGWILRSGHADGCDLACENGFLKESKREPMEIYLPFAKFNGAPKNNPEYISDIPEKAEHIASQIIDPEHWANCNDMHRKFHSRNVCQVLGEDLKSPSNVVLCWTTNGKNVGGTATALRLADAYHIPIINLGEPAFSMLNNPLFKIDLLKEIEQRAK